MDLVKKIRDIEKEISRTQKNKATEYHLGQLRARMNKLKKQLDGRGEGHLLVEEGPEPTPDDKKGKSGNKGKKGKAGRNDKEKKVSSSESSAIESQSESEEEVGNVDRPANRFAFLDEPDQDQSSLKEDDKESEADNASNQHIPTDKKRKKKTTKKKQSKEDQFGEMDNEQLLDYLAQQNEMLKGQIGEQHDQENCSKSSWKTDAGVQVKYLNYRHELQKIMGGVGNGLLEGEMGEEAGGGGGRARDRGPARTSKGVQHLFVTPNPRQWPDHLLKDFLHRYLHLETEGSWMIFRRSRRYKDLQRDFLLLVFSNQEQAVQDILHQMPLHSDANLLLSGLYERDGNYASARQAVENVLICYQGCFDHHQRNNPITHRLSYRYPANRAYMIALYKHTLFNAPRFPKTAFQLGKYLFNLNPVEDPLGMVLILDYLALKARDYAYVMAFHQALKERKRLELLPSWAFSLALAAFHFDTSHQGRQQADQFLTQAVLRFPGLVVKLYEKMEMRMEARVANSGLFRNYEEANGLNLLEALYIRRCVSLWKEGGVTGWMERTVGSVVEQLDTPDLKQQLDHYAHLRKHSYRGTPSNVWRHVMIMNIPESETVFQLRLPEESGNFVFPFDPIPPANTAQREECDVRIAPPPQPAPSPHAVPSQPETGLLERVAAAAGLFFQTLMPSSAAAHSQSAAVQEADFLGRSGGSRIVMGAAIDEETEQEALTCLPDGLPYLDKIDELYSKVHSGL